MKYYALYNTANGDIIQTGNAPELETLPYMVADGQSYIVSDAPIDAKTQRISADGRLIAKRRADIEARENAEAWRKLRFQRAQLLASSDWTQMPDSPADQKAWRQYRQALRDLPANTTDPRNPEWPEPPK